MFDLIFRFLRFILPKLSNTVGFHKWAESKNGNYRVKKWERGETRITDLFFKGRCTSKIPK